MFTNTVSSFVFIMFSLCRGYKIISAFVDVPTEIILRQRVESCPKLFQNYFRSLLQLINIFQHVQCRLNNLEIISAAEKTLK